MSELKMTGVMAARPKYVGAEGRSAQTAGGGPRAQVMRLWGPTRLESELDVIPTAR